ncbi:MAG: choice-of-anchor D domain-containing protein [Candidatus Kapaibacterium sp.]
MKIFFRFCTYVILALVASQAATAQFSGRIFNRDFPRDTVIHLGPCLVGDSLKTTFLLENTGEEALLMGQSAHTIYLGRSQGERFQDEFREFAHVAPPIPYIIEPERRRDSIVIRYLADDNLLEFPYGQKQAYLMLALAKFFDETQTVASATFTVKAHKTWRYVDGFESTYDFDSVYVNPAQPKIFDWRIKNCWTGDVLIDSARLRMISAEPDGPGFSADVEPAEFSMGSDAILEKSIGYSPTRIGESHARMEYFFRPQPITFPDSVDTAKVEIFGTGVRQDIRMTSSTVELHSDTLDFGDVRIGADSEAKITLENFGNLPFGASACMVLRGASDEVSENFLINDKLLKGGNHLYPNESTTFSVLCQPANIGNFTGRLIIVSDINTRGIYGVPAEAVRKIIYLRGRGVRPILELPGDTMSFGNVVRSLQCPATADTVVAIRNSGNEQLIISHIFIDPSLMFGVSRREMTIAPNSQDTLTLYFSPDYVSEFTAGIYFVTNDARGIDTTMMELHGTGVPLVSAQLSIPADTAKPGSLIELPIILKNGRARYAKKFIDTLSYDYSLLRYVDAVTFGTAAEGAMSVNIDEFSHPGRLPILIESGFNNYFSARDTIILLQFRVFLGERISAPIAFGNPRFGDYKCEQVLDLSESVINGSITLDSVCGLNLKAHKLNGGGFGRISPNPASGRVNIEFRTTFESRVNISLYDSYGRIAKEITDAVLPAGNHEEAFDAGALAPGVYYCRMRFGIMDRSEIITIIK